jgi:hypothetical protein
LDAGSTTGYVFLLLLFLLWYDNISAYHMAKNPVFHAQTKHMEIDLHFIRNQVLKGKLQLQFVPTEEQANRSID